VARRIAQIGAVEALLLGRTEARRAFVAAGGSQPRRMRRLDPVLSLGVEGQHRAVARRRGLAVEGRADIDAVRVRALRAVADPAAIGEFALMAEGSEECIVEPARR